MHSEETSWDNEMALTLEQKFQKAEENESYALNEFNKLRHRYPDMHVGIVDGEVKYHDKDIDTLLSQIRTDRGSTEGVFVIFVPSKRATVVF